MGILGHNPSPASPAQTVNRKTHKTKEGVCLENCAHLLGSSLNAAVLAGNIFAVPVISCSTRKTEVWITFTHSQIAWTLLSVALCFTAASRKPVLAFKMETVREMAACKKKKNPTICCKLKPKPRSKLHLVLHRLRSLKEYKSLKKDERRFRGFEF